MIVLSKNIKVYADYISLNKIITAQCYAETRLRDCMSSVRLCITPDRRPIASTTNAESITHRLSSRLEQILVHKVTAAEKARRRFQFTDAPHLHYVFPHFCCLTFTNFMSTTVITNPCNIITGACPAYCSWPRCHHSQTINLFPTAVRNCPRPREKVVHHVVLQQYCRVLSPAVALSACAGDGASSSGLSLSLHCRQQLCLAADGMVLSL